MCWASFLAFCNHNPLRDYGFKCNTQSRTLPSPCWVACVFLQGVAVNGFDSDEEEDGDGEEEAEAAEEGEAVEGAASRVGAGSNSSIADSIWPSAREEEAVLPAAAAPDALPAWAEAEAGQAGGAEWEAVAGNGDSDEGGLDEFGNLWFKDDTTGTWFVAYVSVWTAASLLCACDSAWDGGGFLFGDRSASALVVVQPLRASALQGHQSSARQSVQKHASIPAAHGRMHIWHGVDGHTCHEPSYSCDPLCL